MVGIGRPGNANPNVNINNGNQPPNVQQSHIGHPTALRSISSGQLFEAMGGRPKSDIAFLGKVLYPKSTMYKQVANDLDNFRKSFDELAKTDVSKLTKGQIQALKSDLLEAIEHAGAYQTMHRNDPEKANRRQAMEDLKDSIKKDITFLDKLLELKTNFSQGTNVGDAFAMLKSDVESGFLIVDAHKNDILVEEPTALGAGGINTVYLAKWRQPDQSILQVVLKPLTVELPKGVQGADLGGDIGVTREHQMGAERNIATGKVAEMLGLLSLVPPSNVVVFKGQVCLEMPLAEGKQLMGEKVVVFNESDPITGLLRNEEKNEKQRLANEQRGMVAVGKNEDGESIFGRKQPTPRDFPFASSSPNPLTANLQRAMLDLQVVDVLCGQADRNMNNFFIKVVGHDVTVTGIDHDISFGEKEGEPQTDFTQKSGGFPPRPWPGLPPLMMKDTFDKLMLVNRMEYKTNLESSGLTPPQVDLAMTRFDKLKEHATELNNKGLVVTDLIQDVTDPATKNKMNVSDFLTQPKSSNYIAQFTKLQSDNVVNGNYTDLLAMDA